jgi:hypothetical protein
LRLRVSLSPAADEEMEELSVNTLAKRLARKFKCDYKDIKPSVKRAVKDYKQGAFVCGDDAAGNSACWAL